VYSKLLFNVIDTRNFEDYTYFLKSKIMKKYYVFFNTVFKSNTKSFGNGLEFGLKIILIKTCFKKKITEIK